MTKGEDST
jgi:hypothetical protein